MLSPLAAPSRRRPSRSPSGRARTPASPSTTPGPPTRLAGQHLRAGRRGPVLPHPGPAVALRLPGHDPVPRAGLQPLARLPRRCPALNMVDAIVPRTASGGARATSPARWTAATASAGGLFAISGDGFLEGVQGPGGRVALVDGPTTTRAPPVLPLWLERRDRGQHARPVPRRGVHRHSRRPSPARSSLAGPGSPDARTTHAFRLGAGGDPNNVAPPGSSSTPRPWGRGEPALAGLPGGFAVMLEPLRRRQGWTAPRGSTVLPPVPPHPRGQQQGFEGCRQHQGPPDRG